MGHAFWIAGCFAWLALASAAHAQHETSPTYRRAGELSPGTQAPSPGGMLRAIEGAGPEQLVSTLEYGERVVCPACVPLLQRKLLESESARVREISAWWLRRQPYASGPVLVWLRAELDTSKDAERRARAVEALGEFMDTSSLEAISEAALEDASEAVRVRAVGALARLDMEAATAALVEALSDDATSVRLEALSHVLRVNFFADHAALMPLLADDDAEVRRRAARLAGELRIVEADAVLQALLEEDASAPVRQAAAWSLGRLGSARASRALAAAQKRERDPRVLDAIDVAERM